MVQRRVTEEDVCTICRKVIKPGEATIRVDGLAHIRCVSNPETERKS